MSSEQALDGGALNTLPAPVNEPYLAEPLFRGRVQVGIDNGHDIPRRERVKVDTILDWHFNRVVVHVVSRVGNREPEAGG